MESSLFDFHTLPRLDNIPGTILLIFPPFHRIMGEKTQWIPMGLSSIASSLSALGADVKVYNADNTPYITKQDESRLNCWQRFQNTSLYMDVINQEDHEVWQEIQNVITTIKPFLVGVSVHTENVPSANKICKIIKEISTDIITVCGGPHITLAETQNMPSHLIDYIVKGEGEIAFVELINTIISSWSEEKVFQSKKLADLTTLPRVDTSLILNVENYPIIRKKRMVGCSRGCPGKCGFCSAPQLWSNKIRYRKINDVIDELKNLLAEGTEKIFFIDDTFITNYRYTIELCQEIIENNLKFSWTCTTRATTIKPGLLQLMKQAGCHSIHLGVESGSEKMLDLVCKGVKLKKIREAAQLIKEAGIELSVFMLVGFPGETKEDIIASMDLVKELEADEVLVHPLVPLIGTPIYNIARKKRYLKEDIDWSTWTRNNLLYSFFSDMQPSEVDSIVKDFFILAGDDVDCIKGTAGSEPTLEICSGSF